MTDRVCPYCIEYFDIEPVDCAICWRCKGTVFVRVAPTGFQRLVTQLHVELLDQQWPDYLTRAQCVRIVECFEFNLAALEVKIRSGARHLTEATLLLLGEIASGRDRLREDSGRQAPRQRAWLQLARMAHRQGKPYRAYLRQAGIEDPNWNPTRKKAVRLYRVK